MIDAQPLAGERLLITGASSGLGAHFARLAVAAGAEVVAAARRVDALDALVAELRDVGGRRRRWPWTLRTALPSISFFPP